MEGRDLEPPLHPLLPFVWDLAAKVCRFKKMSDRDNGTIRRWLTKFLSLRDYFPAAFSVAMHRGVAGASGFRRPSVQHVCWVETTLDAPLHAVHWTELQ